MTRERNAMPDTDTAPPPDPNGTGAPLPEEFGADAPALESHEDLVRRAAYAKYEQRGKEGGHEVEDWLSAEEEVTASERGSPA
jgi:hypothetical protein